MEISSGRHAPDELLPSGETDYVKQIRESINRRETPTGIPDPGSLSVFYDLQGRFPLWEDDPDSEIMYREDYRSYEDQVWGKPKTLRPLASRQRAKEFKTWTENGQPVGGWDWIYRPTP